MPLLAALLLAAPSVPAQDLEQRVDAAIDRGVAYLLSEQSRDGSWGGLQPRWPRGITELAAYTLLKSGLDREHQALRRARAYLLARPTSLTYPLSLELLVLAAMGYEEDEPAMERALEALLEIRTRSGWNYPGDYKDGAWVGNWPDPDFSNLHYAVFGLGAADDRGLKLPRGLWDDVLDAILLHLNEPEEALGRNDEAVEVAGYAYRLPGRGTKASLVAAGAAMLAVCRDAPSADYSKRRLREIERAVELNRNWLDTKLEIGRNVGSDLFQYYWLLSLERAISLHGWEELAGLPVYRSGAAWICDAQRDDGSWRDGKTTGHLAEAHSDTCFALLFLLRATRPAATGGEARVRGAFASVDTAREVSIRGRVREQVEVWIEDLRGATPRVERVEWWLGGELVETVAGDAAHPWEGERFAARLPLVDQDPRALRASVHVVAEDGARAVLESDTVIVSGVDVLEPWMLEAAAAVERNLLQDVEIATHASSVNAQDHPWKVLDDAPATLWLAARDDEAPWLELELGEAVRANTLVLSSANWKPSYRGHFDRPTRLLVTIDKAKTPLEVKPPERDAAPYVIPLGRTQRMKRVRIEVLSREPGQSAPGLVGLSELALELR